MIKGRKISLRALEPDDIEWLYDLENDQELWTISETLQPVSRFALEQYLINAQLDIHTTKQMRLIIMDHENSDPLGTIELFDIDPLHARAGIGIMVVRSQRGKGYATEAIALMMKYAAEVLGLKQVYCNVLEENKRSLDLFINQGFRKIGTKKAWIKAGNEWKNEVFLQKILD